MSKLSVIIPVYWNADTLEPLYEDLKTKILGQIDDYEIIMVDDGSGDGSWEVINKIHSIDEKVVAVRLSRNFGEHAALLAGFSVCTGDCAVTKQADMQEDSSLILKMYSCWQRGKKVVLAGRETRKDSFFTKLFAGIYYRLIRKYVFPVMPKGGCDCYLIDRQVIETILSMDELNSSLTLQVMWTGYRPEIVYFDRSERKSGKGRWTFAKKFKLLLDSFVSFTYLPIRIMWLTGILFLLFSVIMAVIIFKEYFSVGTPIAGWSSLMCVVLLSAGLILWMLGMLGEYIWRTFDASRNRRPFIIEEINRSQE